MLDEFAYWVKQKVDSGYLYRVADLISPSQLMDKCHLLLNQKKGKNLNYTPNNASKKPIYRYTNIQNNQIQASYVVSDNLQQQNLDWLQGLLEDECDPTVERSTN